MVKHRSRRLQKKLRVGEFQEFGFVVQIQAKDGLSTQEIESFMDAFLAQAIAPRDLDFAGWVEGGLVARASRGSATEADRAAVLAWLRQRPEVESAEAGELIDAWNELSFDHVI